MDALIELLNAIPNWLSYPLVVLTFLVVLNKLSDNRPGAFIANWFDRKMTLQDKRYDAVYTMLRESIEERSREQKELDDKIDAIAKRLGEGQASLAVRQSENRALISSQNLHHTGHHDQLNAILKNQEVIKEKIEGIMVIMINYERRAK